MTIETSVTAASGHTSRKVVGIATAAISSGTIAISELKTKMSTIRAPAPATSTSSSTLTLVSPSPAAEAARSASRPVTSTGDPPTVTPSSAAWACRASA